MRKGDEIVVVKGFECFYGWIERGQRGRVGIVYEDGAISAFFSDLGVDFPRSLYLSRDEFIALSPLYELAEALDDE